MWFFNKVAATIITVITLFIAIIFFLNYFNSISVIDNFQKLNIQELKQDAKVYQTTGGIKHIIAKNESDAYFMIGFVQSGDRLFQMDILRRIAKGELSAVFGERFINNDKYMRTFGLNMIANSICSVMPKESKLPLQRFSDGINKFIDINQNRLPFGFSVYNYKPSNWSVEDCVLILRLFALQLNTTLQADLDFGSIAEIIGVDQTLSLLPDTGINATWLPSEIMSDSSKNMNQRLSTIIRNSELIYSIVSDYNNELQYLMTNNRLNDNIYKDMKGSAACNSWALKKIVSKQSPAILANDFHSNLSMPAMWYQIHYSYPGVNALGFSIPGLPFIWSGRNDNIAWGISNSMIDDFDYFIEKLCQNKNYYKIDNTDSLEFKYIKDTINVKNAEDHIYYLRSTHRSFVISDFYGGGLFSSFIDTSSKQVVAQKYILSYKWSGMNNSDETGALINLSKSKSWNEFKLSFKNWFVPALDFTYCDKEGNIGSITVGALAERSENNMMAIPSPGWLPEFDWKGIENKGIISSVYNPLCNFVASANNASENTRTYSFYHDISSRAKRISELIGQYQETENYIYSHIDAQRMQSDILSVYARELCSEILPIIEYNKETLTQLELNAYLFLKKWDFIISPASPSSSIFNMYMKTLIENVFLDELGDMGFKYYLSNNSFAYRKILELIKNKTSIWFDNVKTDNILENRAYMVMISFKDAINRLDNLYQTKDLDNWNFGEKHKIKIADMFKDNYYLSPLSDIQEIIAGGDNTTINYHNWDYFSPFNVVKAPSMRLIADMSDSLLYTSIPGGISGEPMDPNYSSQLHLWENGGYIAIPVHSNGLNSSDLILECYR